MGFNAEENKNVTILAPIWGFASCGLPSEWMALKGFREIRPLKADLTGTRTTVVRVQGSSMEGDRIFEGDWAICYRIFERQEIEKFSGLPFLVTLPDGPAIKRVIVASHGSIHLKSSNPRFKDIRVATEDLQVFAVVMRVERDFI
jgi:SOS-response transcriptional repressor LexA